MQQRGLHRGVVLCLVPQQLEITIGAAVFQDELQFQLLHGPLDSQGDFARAAIEALDMEPVGDGVYRVSFEPDSAGAWGVTVRTIPVHPAQISPYDTGLVTSA